MKKLLITILFFIPCFSQAAIVHVQSPSGGTDCGTVSSCNLAFGSNNTAGNMIVVNCRFGAIGRTVTVTDTQGNTYIGQAGSINATNATDGHTENVQWATNIKAGANTVTCAVSGATTIMRLIVSEFSGTGTSNSTVRDQVATTSGSGVPASGSITPRVNGELLYGFEGNGATGGAGGAGTDFTLATCVPVSPSRICSEYYVQPTAAAHDGTFTPSQTNWSAGLVSFFAASSTPAAISNSFHSFMVKLGQRFSVQVGRLFAVKSI